MQVIKRDGNVQDFDINKIKNAVRKALEAVNETDVSKSLVDSILIRINARTKNPLTVEDIQDIVEEVLMDSGYYGAAKAFILYREKHKELRFIKERVD